MRISRLAVLLPALYLAACSPAEGPLGDSEHFACVKEPDRLAEAASCLRDEDCACGARCDLGRCTQDCIEDGDCATGQWCDEFGWCRRGQDRDVFVAPDTAQLGRVSLAPRNLYLAGDATARLTVSGRGQDLDRVRLEAEPGLSLGCPDGSEGDSCVFPLLRDEPETIAVTATAEAEPGTTLLIRAWYGGRSTVAHVERVGDTPAPPPPPLAGEYVGEMRLVELRYVGAMADHRAAPAPGLVTLPVRASVAQTGQGWAVRLADGLGVFAGPGGLADARLYIDADPAFSSGTVPAFRPAPAPSGPDEADLIQGGSATLVQGRGTVSGEVRLQTGGMLQRAPTQVWRLTLERAGDLTREVVLPVPATPDHDLLQQAATAPGMVGQVLASMAPASAGDLAAAWGNDPDSLLRCTWPAGRDFTWELCRDEGIPACADALRPGPASGARGVDPWDFIWFDGGFTIGQAESKWGCEPQACAWEVWTGQGWACQEACVFQPLDDASRCGELIYCRPEGDASGTFDGEALDGSGDLQCRSGSSGAEWMPPAVAFALEAGLASGTPRNALLESCLADLDRDPTLGSGSVFEARACLDVVRFRWALDRLLEGPRQAALQDTAKVYDGRTPQRLLREWLMLHGFLARSGLDLTTLHGLFQAEEPPASLRELVDRVDAGWDLLLHPRQAVALEELAPLVLADPDYRPGGGDGEQAVGLPVALLETASAELTLLDAWLEDVAFAGSGRDDALAVTGRAVRRILLAWTLAEGLRGQALIADASAAWAVGPASRWTAARDELDARLDRVLARAVALQEGANPLGVSDEDLPLYFDDARYTASQRAFLVTDYFLGPDGKADAAVAAASQAVSDARSTWESARDDALGQRQALADQAAGLQAVRDRYGAPLQHLCGLYDDAPGAALDTLAGQDAASCFIDRTQTGCDWDQGAIEALLSPEDAAFDLCVAAKLRAWAGPAVTLSDPDLAALVEALAEAIAEDMKPSLVLGNLQLDTTRKLLVASVGGGRFGVAVSALFFPRPGIESVPAADVQRAREACAAAFPASRQRLPALGDLPDSPLDRPECYRGSMGEAALAARSNAVAVQAAESALSDFVDSYDHAMEGCMALQEANGLMADLRADHEATMRPLRNGRRLASTIGEVAGTLARTMTNPTRIFSIAGTVVAAGFEAAMEEAEQAHAETMQRVMDTVAEQQCFHEAEANLIGVSTQGLAIQRARVNLSNALLVLENLQGQARSLAREGQAAVARELSRVAPDPAHDYGLDGDLARARGQMRRARRYAYLAVRAVEYELQESTIHRSAVLSARTPAELEAALSDLHDLHDARKIDEKSFGDRLAVVSLRHDLLELADRRDRPRAEHRLTAVERLRQLLVSPEYAVHDASGAYLGQEIPFRLVPAGVATLEGDGVVVGLNDCAERLWGVNVAIFGTDLVEGATTTRVPVELHKRNAFYSQWCSPSGMGAPFQVASIQPDRNLLREPTLEGTELLPLPSASDFGTARVNVKLTATLDDLETSSYVEGMSQELAGRSLYGEYSLFFPGDAIVVDGADARSRLDLRKVDDIYLRFDFVSVARQ